MLFQTLLMVKHSRGGSIAAHKTLFDRVFHQV